MNENIPSINNEKPNAESMLRRFGLNKGQNVILKKIASGEGSYVSDGSESAGVLEYDVNLDGDILLDSGAKTTRIKGVREVDGKIQLLTRTGSVYVIEVEQNQKLKEESSSAEEILNHFDLKEGRKVTFVKRQGAVDSEVPIGSTATGALMSDVQLGKAIELDSGTQISVIKGVSEKEGRLFIKTETAVIEIIIEKEVFQYNRIEKADLDREQVAFERKGYGEWAMFKNQVPLEDKPSYVLFQKAGLRDGDEVIFFVEKEKTGTIKGDHIVDSDGNPWGVSGILGAKDAYIEKMKM